MPLVRIDLHAPLAPLRPRLSEAIHSALVDGWGGLYAVATRPEARRRGHARALASALAAEACARGLDRLWLQVLADNAPAIGLYASLGFEPASRYAYWTRG